MNIGILGGSFDPPHFGHIFLCHYAIETTMLDEILVVPCFKHAFDKPLSDFEHRFNMCKLAFHTFGSAVEVSDIEREIGGVSFTVNTIEYLKNKFPMNNYYLFVGSDILPQTHQWKDFDKLTQLADIIVFQRRGVEEIPHKEQVIRVDLPDIESSRIRNLSQNKQSIKHLTTDKVIDYIEKNNLYQ